MWNAASHMLSIEGIFGRIGYALHLYTLLYHLGRRPKSRSIVNHQSIQIDELLMP